MIGIGRDGFTVTPWQGDPTVAYVRVRDAHRQVDAPTVSRLIEGLATSGYTEAVTPALHQDETHAYFANGFREVDSLVVLSHGLDPLPRPRGSATGSIRIRRARRRDLNRIFELDERAFPPRWKLDDNGLDEARRATTHVHFRTARDTQIDGRSHDQVVGYAISGRTGQTAFLQRLAVDPDHSGRGTGSALVIDGLRWALDHRCSNLLVNTQTTNHRALSLYESLGFVESATRLVVLRCRL